MLDPPPAAEGVFRAQDAPCDSGRMLMGRGWNGASGVIPAPGSSVLRGHLCRASSLAWKGPPQGPRPDVRGADMGAGARGPLAQPHGQRGRRTGTRACVRNVTFLLRNSPHGKISSYGASYAFLDERPVLFRNNLENCFYFHFENQSDLLQLPRAGFCKMSLTRAARLSSKQETG